jgi:hypothetical protein
MMAVESVAHGIAEIAQQVEPVGNLGRLWSAGPDTVSIGAGPVAGDDLDTGMRLQPGGDGLGRGSKSIGRLPRSRSTIRVP